MRATKTRRVACAWRNSPIAPLANHRVKALRGVADHGVIKWNQNREQGLALHQHADLWPVFCALDRTALPMAGHQTFLDLSRAQPNAGRRCAR